MTGETQARRTAVLSERECARLLKTKDVGRLALVVDGRPEIFPVNYAFDERAVVFRTSPGMKLERGPYTAAAFEVDHIDRASRVAWSVVVHGTAHDITGSADRLSERLRTLVVRPVAPGQRRRWMAIYADRITGRRFRLG
jgi:nitroimidazol reductase NimA-like FMN-containing flavoprotein (pyridoxamine 5'-phosphate oxidase superfamily)